MDNNSCIGRVVISKAGRDENKSFIVLSILDDKYVYICDGNLRTLERPKKKKVKHLTFTNTVAKEIRNLLLAGEKVNNAIIRKFLQSYDNSKEV